MTDERIPQFGEPMNEIPPPRPRPISGYWNLVVEHAKANHGQWIPLINCPLSRGRLSAIAMQMGNRDDRYATIPVAMRIPGMRTMYTQGTLFFRYDKPEG